MVKDEYNTIKMGNSDLRNKKKLLILACLALVFTLTSPVVHAATAVSQYGITWMFDGDYSVGQFANGDYWVVGPVVITRITPDFDGSNNGWEVNPVVEGNHGFQKGCYRNERFDAGLVPPLPYIATPGESIVKTTPSGGDRPCLKTAAVLTVVGSIPPDNGASVFRPPYVGTDKPYYSINDLRMEFLPSYAPVANAPSLDWVVERFKRVQLDHKGGDTGRALRPSDNMDDYAPNNAKDSNDAVLRLMLNDPIADKMPALIAFIQGGIDAYHAVLNGQTWPAGGGYQPGHKLVLTFTAAMFDNEVMKNTVKKATFFNEDGGVYRSSVTGMALYGFVPPDGSHKTQKDPYEYIDAPNGGYIFCCLALPWKGSVLAVHLMPAMQEIWDGPDWVELSEFVDRWVGFGRWYLPDPYNRHPEWHGTDKNGGYRGSAFQEAMWNAYRDGDDVPPSQPKNPRIVQ